MLYRLSYASEITECIRAMTRDGRAVAVKVQYPGVDRAIEGDLDNAGMLFSAMTFLFPGLDPEPLVEELRERIIEELDYRIEADNQRLFADAYEGHPFIHVPAVVDAVAPGDTVTCCVETVGSHAGASSDNGGLVPVRAVIV